MSGIQMALLGAGGLPPLTISISPASLYDTRVGNGNLTSSTATGTGAGGSGTGYTYAWTYVSGDSYTINSPSAAATTFTTSLIVGIVKTGTYRCTVTDSLSNTANATIVVSMEAT